MRLPVKIVDPAYRDKIFDTWVDSVARPAGYTIDELDGIIDDWLDGKCELIIPDEDLAAALN